MSIRTVPDNIVRVYSRVDVKVDCSGAFIVLVGENVPEEDSEEQSKTEEEEIVEEEEKMVMIINNDVKGGNAIGINGVEMHIIESDRNRSYNINSEECSFSGGKKILCNSDVNEWTASQQDFSELFFLGNNANNSGAINNINIRINTDLNSKNNDVENIKNSENDKRMNQIEKKDKEKNERNKKEKSQNVPLLLEMKEPSPDTPHGMDQWLLWFDSLKISENILLSYLK